MFLDYKDISSREAYDFYKKNRKTISKTIDQYNYFKKAVEGVIRTLIDLFLENEEGVCIRDLGYFCMVKTKNKKKIKNPSSTSILKKYIKRYVYKPYMFPDVMYENWSMEYGFSKNINVKIKRNSTKNYKMHKVICDSIMISEDFIKKADKNKKNPIRNKNYKKEARK